MKFLNKNLIGLMTIVIVLFQFSVNAQDTLDYEKIEKNIDKYLTYFSGDNPGAVVTVIKKGDIIFNKAYGLSNVELNEKMTIDKEFNIGELSKAFTSLAIMKLVEKNKLNLDDNLSDIFENFPEYGKKIKIRYLLNHSSGLINYNEDSIKSNEEVLDFLIEQNDVASEPGLKMNFSNSDYAVLAKIIEKISGMLYNDFLNKYIFKKLSMANTYLVNDISSTSNIAVGHFKENEQYYPDKVLNNIYGDQGIYSTVLDFVKWDKALYTDKLLKCENLSKIFSVEPLIYEKRISYYGYGWVLMEKNNVRYYWHGGSGNGYSSLILHLPDTNTTVLLLTNRDDGYDFLKMAIYIAKLFDKSLKL